MSAAFPPALRLWEPLLGEISPDLLGTLELWLPRLGALIGPAVHQQTDERAEPDGYSGFTNRGIPERLVLGEWALRELYPDEFLRRALDGEQLYLRQAHRSPRAARQAIVLFDTGAEQIGATRLAHLALLVVLTARARKHGGILTWAALPEGGTVRAVSLPQDLARLASARSWKVGPWPVQAWTDRIGDIEDRFVVGGEGARALAEGLDAELLQVSEVGESVVVQRAGGRRVVLPLDDRARAASALRAPLAAPPPPPPAVHSSESIRSTWLTPIPRTLLFSHSSRQLIVELESGWVAACQLGPKRKRHFRPKEVGISKGERPLAATMYRHRLTVLSLRGDELWLSGLAGRSEDRGGPVPLRAAVPEPEPTVERMGLAPAIAWRGPSGKISMRYRLGTTVCGIDDAGVHQRFRSGVLAFGRGPSGIRTLGPGDQGIHLSCEPIDGTGHPFSRPVFELPAATDARMGPLGSPSAPVPCGCLAVRGLTSWWAKREGLWKAERGEPVQIQLLSEEERVVGVGDFSEVGLEVALVLLLGGRRVVARGTNGQVALLTLPTPPLNLAMDQGAFQLAVADVYGRVLVYDLHSGQVTGRIESGRVS